ncbi:MAG TPA: site-specific integrase [Acidobacteriaceae bacterium]|nr:site-specific integrase [Acidobacteriaceae bacterium]
MQGVASEFGEKYHFCIIFALASIRRCLIAGEARVPRKAKEVVGVYELEPGLWCGRYRTPDGKLIRKRFGSDRKAAVAWVEEARTIRRNNAAELPATAILHKQKKATAEPPKVTVGLLCDEFLRYVKSHPDEYRDQKNPPRRIEQIRTEFGDRPAETLKSSEIEEWLDSVQEDREVSNATINKLRGTFSMLYKHGKRKDLIDLNPAADVPLRDVGESIERFLSTAEEKRLRAVLEADIAAHAEHAVLKDEAVERLLEFDVSLRSGMRKSEQYNLRWPDIDYNRKIMRLRKTKNGKPRNAFMIDDTIRALKQLHEIYLRRSDRQRKQGLELDDKVFSKVENKKWWLAAVKQAKIKNYRWHDNRHTFCSRLVQAGVHLKVVQEAAGHQTIASTMRYAHFAPSQVVDAMAVLNWQGGAAT